MSHTMGVMCVLHRTVMVSDMTCPEGGCKGSHGFTVAACDSRCPQYEPSPATTDTALRWPELQGAMRARDVFARALAEPLLSADALRKSEDMTRRYVGE